jgi:hypothetical protein
METEKTISPKVIYKEKDVLGLDEPNTQLTKPASKPNRLFLGIGLVVLAIYIVYRLFKHFQ